MRRTRLRALKNVLDTGMSSRAEVVPPLLDCHAFFAVIACQCRS